MSKQRASEDPLAQGCEGLEEEDCRLVGPLQEAWLPELSATTPSQLPHHLGVTGEENKPGFRARLPRHESQLCPSRAVWP